MSWQQKLGAITLPEKEEVVELYDWCGLTIQSKDNVQRELGELKAQLKAKEAEAEKINEELAQMVKLKNNHENDLIEKFSLLLNEKKLKIRDQQRLLATANVDPAKAAALERSKASAKSGSAGPSKARKRKAGKVGQGETDSDEGFEKMDVDNQQDDATDSEGELPRTPERDSTPEVDSEDEAPPAPPPARKAAGDKKAAGSNAAPDASESEDLPPRRELPFSKKPASKQAVAPKAVPTGDSETESDDDEL
jgi:DNA double-strand break repair and V(D)J recombination protein XRCC4